MFWRRNKEKSARRSLTPVSKNHRVISYYTATRRQLNSFERADSPYGNSRNRRQIIHQLRNRLFIITVLVILFIMAAYQSSLNTQYQIRVEGYKYRSDSEYASIINDSISIGWRRYIKLLIPENRVEEDLEKVITEAGSIDVYSPTLGRRLVVVIHTIQPLVVVHQTGTEDFIINDRGKIVIKKSDMTKQESLPNLQNDSPVDVKIGQQYFGPESAGYLRALIDQYNSDSAVKPVYSLSAIPKELLVQEPGRGYKVKYLLSENILQQYGALRAAEKELSKKQIKPSEYVDVRLADKVYYK